MKKMQGLHKTVKVFEQTFDFLSQKLLYYTIQIFKTVIAKQS